MKIVGFMALHYGIPYISYAIRSVIADVDELHVAYSASGSHGHRSDAVCPDTRDELYALAEYAAGSKLRWHEGSWNTEGEQRETIFQTAPDADVIVVVDSDELFGRGMVSAAVEYALETGVHRLRLPFVHLWRSFWRGFPHDPAYPERIICPKQQGGTLTFPTPKRVWHFGYALPYELVAYKWRIHGHLNEMRKDVDWLREVFLANRQTDCHPVGSSYWNAEDIDPFEQGLPAFMASHPFADLEVIP